MYNGYALSGLNAASFSNYILDILVIVGIFIYALICAKRGFINCFFGFVSSIACFFIAILLARGFSELTGGLFGLQDVFTESFTDFFSGFEGFDVSLSGMDADKVLSNATLPSIIASLVLKKYTGETFAEGTTLATAVGASVAELAITVISGILLYILCRIGFHFLRKLVDAIVSKITLIDKVNTLLGAIVGLVEGLFILCAVLAILTIIPSEGLLTYLNDSLFLGALYNHNPLLGFMVLLI